MLNITEKKSETDFICRKRLDLILMLKFAVVNARVR